MCHTILYSITKICKKSVGCQPLIWINRTGSSNSFVMSRFWNQLTAILDHPKFGVCKQIILQAFRNRFRMPPLCSLYENVGVIIIKLFWGLHSILLLLPTAAMLEWPPAAIFHISMASQERRGKLYHLISMQSTHFVRQLAKQKPRQKIPDLYAVCR